MIKKQFSKTKQVCKVTFTLPKKAAKSAKVVKVLGDFNDWNWRKGVKMTSTKTGFKAVVELEAGQNYEFRYLIDNKTWENDWAADDYVPNDFGMNNSVVVLPKVKGVAVKKTAMKKVTAKSKAAMNSRSKSTSSVKKKMTSGMMTSKKRTSKSTSAKKTKMTGRNTSSKRASVIKSTDLTVIEGVGPKICSLLNAAGVKTFSQLSKTSVTKLKTIMADAGSRYKMHNPTSWPKQAKLAAANKWSDLKMMQDMMK